MLSFLKKNKNLILWLIIAGALGGRLGYIFFVGEDKTVILPGATTNGHYQIEQQCDACHTDEKKENVFTSSGVPNSACIQCHGQDLDDFSDSHPVRKFKNPENEVFLKHINALNCVECHKEHNLKITQPMGVTIPADNCAHCHVGTETLDNLETHKNLGFNTCEASGCHNYHDNVALSPGFLRKQYGKPDHLDEQVRQTSQLVARMLEDGFKARAPLTPAEADAPEDKMTDSAHIDAWAKSAHMRGGVNCMDCHQDESNEPGVAWIQNPTEKTCAQCHEPETNDFYKGKHGMRLAEGLSAMTPEMARIPMHTDVAHEALSCSSCHSSHQYDREFASYQACIQCHSDEHTQNYENSKHFKTWKSEVAGTGVKGSGVSCATCHMPTVKRGGQWIVNHNQNANLTPNEKMLKDTCLQCHGAEHAMSALADESLVIGNFHKKPEKRHPGVLWSAETAMQKGDEATLQVQEFIDSMNKEKPQEAKEYIDYENFPVPEKE